MPEAALFAYGSLRFPDVLRTLLDRVPTSSPATVNGWRVAALNERVYPVLVPADSTANGVILTGLSHDEWQTLDAFEDDLYDLRCLTINEGFQAWAYVSDHNPAVLSSDWDLDAFRRDALTDYLERCRRWRQRYEQTLTP
jgi:gamma-glutamylcyclotransferase (GGCT)/AIG2-like uncharacterized protein YtfP